MKLETKWKWFKRFLGLTIMGAGGLVAISIKQQNLVLFVVSISLAINLLMFQIMIGFLDALLEEAI